MIKLKCRNDFVPTLLFYGAICRAVEERKQRVSKGGFAPFGRGRGGNAPSSPLASGEIPYTAFSFASFSLAPTSCKRKATKEFVQIQKTYYFGLPKTDANAKSRHLRLRL